MKRQRIEHQLDGLIALLLFGVFAVCVLAVLLTGANAYRRLTDRDQTAYSSRTCVQYVATRVRQADTESGGIAVEDFDGTTALVLPEGDYVTRVYCCDGYLMELFTDVLSDMGPADGEKIMEAESLDFRLEDGLLTVTAADGTGTEQTLLLSLRSGEGAAS